MYCEIVLIDRYKNMYYTDGKQWSRDYLRLSLFKGVYLYLRHYRNDTDVSLIIGSCN